MFGLIEEASSAALYLAAGVILKISVRGLAWTSTNHLSSQSYSEPYETQKFCLVKWFSNGLVLGSTMTLGR